MKLPMFQVDAFASTVFAGNPAAVCLLEAWPPDEILRRIAAENNLSETAFLVRRGERFELRWFTPLVEMALCGHATLASAHVLFEHRGWPETRVSFQTRKAGDLVVERKGDRLEMDLPARPPRSIPMPGGLVEALGETPLEVLGSEEDCLVVLPDERRVRDLRPDLSCAAMRGSRGVIVTAKGDTVDFVSRFFAPAVGIPEDPVTGSAHCVLTPFWAARLGKQSLHALQVSTRGGELFCADRCARVGIAGRAVTYLEGTIYV
jgi:PhzF family phenazine biosynthesis protein